MLQILAQKVRFVLKYGEEEGGEQAGRLLRVAEMKAPGHRRADFIGVSLASLCPCQGGLLIFMEEAVCILQGYIDCFGYVLHSDQFWVF